MGHNPARLEDVVKLLELALGSRKCSITLFEKTPSNFAEAEAHNIASRNGNR